ncbi:hypothetical protein ON010_g3995 [Phytophthora cinnamomi]|nr:hypothetical protein ON010_g3995 [Phytophthora cinnamomi]
MLKPTGTASAFKYTATVVYWIFGLRALQGRGGHFPGGELFGLQDAGQAEGEVLLRDVLGRVDRELLLHAALAAGHAAADRTAGVVAVATAGHEPAEFLHVRALDDASAGRHVLGQQRDTVAFHHLAARLDEPAAEQLHAVVVQLPNDVAHGDPRPDDVVASFQCGALVHVDGVDEVVKHTLAVRVEGHAHGLQVQEVSARHERAEVGRGPLDHDGPERVLLTGRLQRGQHLTVIKGVVVHVRVAHQPAVLGVSHGAERDVLDRALDGAVGYHERHVRGLNVGQHAVLEQREGAGVAAGAERVGAGLLVLDRVVVEGERPAGGRGLLHGRGREQSGSARVLLIVRLPVRFGAPRAEHAHLLLGLDVLPLVVRQLAAAGHERLVGLQRLGHDAVRHVGQCLLLHHREVQTLGHDARGERELGHHWRRLRATRDKSGNDPETSVGRLRGQMR